MSQPAAHSPDELPDAWRAELARRDSPDERLAVIEDSLRCFAYGWLSLLPVIGMGWLFPAVQRFARARRRQVGWNPAQGYLAAGLALASLGWLMALVSWLLLFNALCIAGGWVAPSSDLLNALPVVLYLGAVPSLVGFLVAWATVWRWLATRPKWFYALAVFLAVTPYALLGQLLEAPGGVWQVPDYEKKFWAEMAGLGIWAIWLFGGFVLLARRNVSLRIWLIWLAVLSVLSHFFTRQ